MNNSVKPISLTEVSLLALDRTGFIKIDHLIKSCCSLVEFNTTIVLLHKTSEYLCNGMFFQQAIYLVGTAAFNGGYIVFGFVGSISVRKCKNTVEPPRMNTLRNK